MTIRTKLRVASILVAALLCACVDEVVVDEASQTTEQTSSCVTADDGTRLALTPTSEALPTCPTGSTRFCNPSGSCRCCWPGTPELCCRTSEPYKRCNLSGLCRCSAT